MGVELSLLVQFGSFIANETIPINLTNTCFRLTKKKYVLKCTIGYLGLVYMEKTSPC